MYNRLDMHNVESDIVHMYIHVYGYLIIPSVEGWHSIIYVDRPNKNAEQV